jgi:hypothetical protein
VLAFLVRDDDVPGGAGATYRATDPMRLAQLITDADRRGFVERLKALERIETRARPRGSVGAAELAEWLVGSLEEPATRSDAAGELLEALDAFRQLTGQVVGTGTPESDVALLARLARDVGDVDGGPAPAVVAASIDAAQRRRLVKTLEAAEAWNEANRTLYSLVRVVDATAADGWLLARLRTAEAADDDAWWLGAIAEEMNDAELRRIAGDAVKRRNEIDQLWPEDWSEAAVARREPMYADVERDLHRDFAAALVRRR